MRESMISLGALGAAIVFLAGCGTTPVQSNSVSPFRPVSTETSITFAEVVASVPVEGAHQVYQNLHVGLAAVISPREAFSSAPAQIDWLVRRLEPRVSSEVLKVLTDSPTISPHKLDHVREIVAARAQAVAGEVLAQSPVPSAFEIEVVVVSMYWTDSTVDPSGRDRRVW